MTVAVELVEETLARGAERSGYHFLFADTADQTIGYTCFGPIAGTRESFDLYWIAVLKDAQGRGTGRDLLERTEAIIGNMGGRRIYVEASSRPENTPVLRFYRACGYRREAHIRDFYAPGDGKMILVKVRQDRPASADARR
jgi:ribosomal protein S18 acetylase RimI-like enzyme